MSGVDALIVALADGRSMRDAAVAARMPSAVAVREAKAFGWPDLDSIRAAAEEIRERHIPSPAVLPGGDPVPPRKSEPIPIEADVEQAMAAGAAKAAAAREAFRDRDETIDVGPVVVTDIPADLDAAVDWADQREAKRDALLIEDTAATLQLIERIATPARPPAAVLDVEQQQRALALREAADILAGLGPGLADLLVCADFIATGCQPAILAPGGAS